MEDNNIQDSCCNSKYASIRQMDKLDEMLGRRFPFYPRTVIQAVHDGRTGASLEAILAQYNNIYMQYQGTAGRTRNIVPKEMRRKGIIISYVDMQGNAITEKCVNDAQRDNFHWGLDVNWVRVDELTLSGDISVSVKGTWVINGEDTGIAALGPKGDNGLTPWLKTIDNKLHFSYDNETWEVCSDYIAAYFRFQDNKFQISRDNKTWSDLSGEVTNSLSIKAYVTDKSQYPNPKQGDMIMVGPTYADDDTEHTKPIYHLNIYNAEGWIDNGPFQSINAGVVQELGNSETEVMSQKAVSEKFSELEENIETYKALTYNSIFEIGDAIYGNGYMSESGRWIVSETTKHICIPIHQYDMLVIKANKDFPCTFAILSDYTINNKNGDNIQFAEGESRVVVNSNSKKSYTVTSENAKYLCINVSNEGNDYMPSSLIVNEYDYSIDFRSNINLSINNSKLLTDISNNFGKKLSECAQFDGMMKDDGTFFNVSSAKHIVIPISKSDVIFIFAGSIPSVFAVLSDYSKVVEDSVIQFAEGESRVVVNSNSKKSYTVTSENAKYLCINISNNEISYLPNKITVNGYDLYTDFRSNINLSINNSKLLTGISNNFGKKLSECAQFDGMMKDDGTFFNVSSAKHIVIPISKSDVIFIFAGSIPSVFAVLSDYSKVVEDSVIQFAEGESRVVVNSNSKKSYTVTSENAKYLCINISNNEISYLPNKITVNGYDLYTDIRNNIADINIDKHLSARNSIDFVKNGLIYLNSQYFISNEGYTTSDKICVIQGVHLFAKLAVPNTVSAITVYDELNAIGWVQGEDIGASLKDYDLDIFNKFPTARYVSVTSRNTVDGYSAYISLEKTKTIEAIYNTNKKRIDCSLNNFLGHSNLDKIFSRPYQYIVVYGQSLSNGSDSLYVKDTAVNNCYMLGDITGLGTELQPLQLTSNGQHPIVSCINSFATLYHNYINPKMNFIAASMGLGGRSIAQLSKAERIEEYSKDYSYEIKDTGAYESRFLMSLNNAVNAVGKQNIECPAIIYLQGERDYVTDSQAPDAQPGSVDSAYACGGDKELYKKRMLDLKNDMQSDIMSYTGQSYKPIFCIYQVSGAFIKNDQMTINMAQIEFAEENEDVFLMPSPYFVPNYNSGHLTTNGYRWYGEFLAKALFSILCQNSYWKPMLPYQCKIEDNKIIISIENNSGKLQFDAELVEQSNNQGFSVYIDDVYADVITSVDIDENRIVLTCNRTLTGNKVSVAYAGMKNNGTGNIRDNDVYQALYNYWDDSKDSGSTGNLTTSFKPSIIGNKYPMYNWLSSFYYEIVE